MEFKMAKELSVPEMSAKSLNAKIDGLAKKHGAWRDEVQVVLVQCARNAFDHGNVDGFTRVVNVLKGADMKAIMAWVKTHAPATYHKQENKFTLNKSFEGEYDALYLMGQAWWDKATEAKDVVTEFDVLEAVQAMIKRAEREVTAKVNIKTIKNLELLKDVRRTVTQYEETIKAA
jgi:hypothetical protein